MIKEFPHGRVIFGDCLEVMPTLERVDLVLTDPPYGIDFQSARRIDKTKRHKKIINDKKPFIWWMYYLHQILNDNGSLMCFTRWDVEDAFKKAIDWAGLKLKSQVIWDKVVHGMGDLRSSYAPQHENILFAIKDTFQFPNKRPKSIYRHQKVSPDNLMHPNEKPVPLLEDICNDLTTYNGVVLDCFSGSFATAIACINTNRKFICIEKDETYFNKGIERIETHYEKMGLFKEAV